MLGASVRNTRSYYFSRSWVVDTQKGVTRVLVARHNHVLRVINPTMVASQPVIRVSAPVPAGFAKDGRHAVLGACTKAREQQVQQPSGVGHHDLQYLTTVRVSCPDKCLPRRHHVGQAFCLS